MIPTIGIMIGAYIGFRCIEMLSRNASHFSSRIARTFTGIMAVLTMAVAAYCSLTLVSSGSGSEFSGAGIKPPSITQPDKADTGAYPPSVTQPTAEELRKQFGLPKEQTEQTKKKD